MRIEASVFLGAQLALWRRSWGSLTIGEILSKGRRRITRRAFLLYRKILTITFTVRNFLTRDAKIPATAAGVTFSLAPEGGTAFHLWSGLRFEKFEVEFILRNLQPGMMFFDIGANAGLFTVAAAKKLLGAESAIYAFEPCPPTFAMLEKNQRLNGIDRVHTVCLALSDTAGPADLHVNVRFKDGLNSLADPSHTDAEVVEKVSIETSTLDDFVAHNGIPRVDVMKVDVEGAELAVFRGGQKLLSREDAPLILYEGYSWCSAGFHYHPVEIMWLLEGCGYELFVLDGVSGRARRRKAGESYDAMMVAVKPSHPRYPDILREGAAA
jgi:FkbM family methyltransferase